MSTILIVEDDPHVADLIQQGLKEDGYKTWHTIDGIAGMELLQKHKIDLVILDILLPKMNGLEVCRKIKTEGYAHLPIMMLTALGSAAGRARTAPAA